MTPTDKLTEMTYHDYKDRYLAALERLCEQFPEANIDDLKREAERLTIKAEVLPTKEDIRAAMKDVFFSVNTGRSVSGPANWLPIKAGMKWMYERLTGLSFSNIDPHEDKHDQGK